VHVLIIAGKREYRDQKKKYEKDSMKEILRE
jgi:hypothetical protein